MKSVIVWALVASGLMASASGVFAHSNPRDFFAIQRGLPYDGAKTPLPAEQPQQREGMRHAYLLRHHVNTSSPAGM